jgi:hypothetical protein
LTIYEFIFILFYFIYFYLFIYFFSSFSFSHVQGSDSDSEYLSETDNYYDSANTDSESDYESNKIPAGRGGTNNANNMPGDVQPGGPPGFGYNTNNGV